MGYYTKYKLEMRSKDPIPDDVMSQINKAFCELWLEKPYEQINWVDCGYFEPSGIELRQPDFIEAGFLNEEQKWYNWCEDMTELSERFPSIGFILYGEGEERDDNWKAAFFGGKSEISHGEITYEYNSLEDVMRHWRAN